MILDSKSIKYDVVDITEPGKENEKEMMQEKSTHKGGTVSDPNPRHALPPQVKQFFLRIPLINILVENPNEK